MRVHDPGHAPCDAGSGDPFRAMGLNCPGELQVTATSSGSPAAIGVRSQFGQTSVFDPREGAIYAVIGSGFVSDLDSPTPGGDDDSDPAHCNDELGAFDVGVLCDPHRPRLRPPPCPGPVDRPANDYSEMRFTVSVPPDVVSLSYDFAFFSVEYPEYYGSAYNDMYVGWLESELWTGNISFDGQGNPISLNASFLAYTDDGGNLAELAGTCMRQHAGTGWLTTSAAVSPGEMITVVFAVFDLSDSILDSYAFLDNFQWGCDPTGKPETKPEG